MRQTNAKAGARWRGMLELGDEMQNTKRNPIVAK
jgi:hypothetical protein